MNSLVWLVIYFFAFLFICLAVYVAVVRAFYWGDKNGPPNGKG